ncbi:hypothetical protein BH10PLA2_BH10PLA2_37770 [soil metagenome]
MNCTDVRPELPHLLATNLDDISDSTLRAHLAGCADCRHEWLEWQQLGKVLDSTTEPEVRVDLTALYREAAARQSRSTRRWRWLGLAATFLLAVGGAWALVGRLEIRVTNQEFALRWGTRVVEQVPTPEDPAPVQPASFDPEKRGEQIELLAAMVRAMVQELQTVDMRQRRDRADMDVRVSGLQEQSLRRWVALQKDLEAIYVLTQQGD